MTPTARIFVSIRDRAACTVACVESLIRTAEPGASIHLYDCGSDAEWPELDAHYRRWLDAGQVESLVRWTPEQLADVYWSKNFAWAHFLSKMRMLPPEEKQFVVMVDNDTIAGPGWLSESIALLRDPGLLSAGLRVLSPYDGPPCPRSHPDEYRMLARITLNSRHVEIRDHLSSRFWVAPWSFWAQFDPPTWDQITRGGKPDRMPTDWYYWKRMEALSQRFGVIHPPICTDPPFAWPSARMTNAIGEDAP